MTTQNIFGDTSWVNQENAVQVLPPTIQWRRGDLTNPNPLLKNGCWQLTVENFAALIGDTLPVVDVLHSGGVVVPSYLLGTIHIAILAYRKRWYTVNDDNSITFLPPRFEGTTGNIKSKLQVWCLCRELANEPVLVSVSGMNSKCLQDAMDSFIKRVITPASRIAKARFARYHFWLPLTSGGKQAVKNNQYITPPVPALGEVDDETLRSLFTGRDVADAAEAMLSEAQDWAAPKIERPAVEAPPAFPDEYDSEPPVAPEDEIPF